MSDLIAQGPQKSDRWRRTLPAAIDSAGRSKQPTAGICIGRQSGTWQVEWDDRISRRHALLFPQPDGSLVVRKLDTARNPVFFHGEHRDRFKLVPGEHFVIGQTTFTLALRPVLQQADVEPDHLTEHAFNREALHRSGFRDAARRIDTLARLPDLIISSTSDMELFVRVSSVLLQATPDAASVAIVQFHSAATQSAERIEILHADCRELDDTTVRPSVRLVRAVMETGESILHLWGRNVNAGGGANAAYTTVADVDWAFCVPVPNDACRGWMLYVSGRLGTPGNFSLEQSLQSAPRDLRDDVKFTGLVATTLGNLRQVRALQRRQAGLRRFFAPVVMEALATRDADQVLEPREAEVSVLFCDLRGFSRRSEEASDHLLDLLHRVSEALGVMTRHILDSDGVVGDFHGDAAMGFWGWPLEQEDAPERACRAALAISAEFFEAAMGGNRSMSGFRCGIGIATGRAVAGRIGTTDQVKVTAFGPVVNLASRLEGMTRPLAADILLDEASARFVRTRLGKDALRIRRLLKVRPAGVLTEVEVSQLLPPYGPQCPLSDHDIMTYEAALDRLIVGRWDEAFALLHDVPADDLAKDFLTATIARHGRVPPPNWDGVIDLPKG